MFETYPAPELPDMLLVRQSFKTPPGVDIEAALGEAFNRIKPALDLSPGARIAVGVGSRGIDNLSKVVRLTVKALKEAGTEPFVMPAMGSHGGATAEGQIEVLRHRGVTEESVGAPIEATMEVVELGLSEGGIPLFLDRLAYEADGIVAVNRIKPHTNFIGRTESGILKMMSIGMGNQRGAEHYHRLSLIRDQYHILSSAGKEVIKRSRFLFGVCLVENQAHQICRLKTALKSEVEGVEAGLLTEARAMLPLMPLDQVDVLIVDEMGKEISGQGIDPNVVGRDCCPYGARRDKPKVTRIFVRDLTAASEGSAVGIGMADFTLRQLVEKIDFHATAINTLTSCCPEGGMIPLAFENDREALIAALMSIRPYETENLGMVRIKNTGDLNYLLVSGSYRPQLESDPGVRIVADGIKVRFDRKGMMPSLGTVLETYT